MTIMVALIIVILGWLALYLAMRGATRRATEQIRAEMQQRIDSLEAKLGSERVGMAAAQVAAALAPPAPASAVTAAPATVPAAEVRPVAPPKKRPVTPETIAVIAAAVTAALGKKVRIRSAKLLYPSPDYVISPWAQQGRVFVQASHNLHLHGR